MTAPRDELHSLVDDIPEEEVPAVLALVRGRLAVGTTWPPRWFGAAKGSRIDTSEQVEEILRRDLGRSA